MKSWCQVCQNCVGEEPPDSFRVCPSSDARGGRAHFRTRILLPGSLQTQPKPSALLHDTEARSPQPRCSSAPKRNPASAPRNYFEINCEQGRSRGSKSAPIGTPASHRFPSIAESWPKSDRVPLPSRSTSRCVKHADPDLRRAGTRHHQIADGWPSAPTLPAMT